MGRPMGRFMDRFMGRPMGRPRSSVCKCLCAPEIAWMKIAVEMPWIFLSGFVRA